jgi:predicted nuclease with TOPRIM domain
MSDIVERLRAVPDLRSDVANAGICREAAAEIERLRARNAEHEARYDALEAKEEYHKREAERLREENRKLREMLMDELDNPDANEQSIIDKAVDEMHEQYPNTLEYLRDGQLKTGDGNERNDQGRNASPRRRDQREDRERAAVGRFADGAE